MRPAAYALLVRRWLAPPSSISASTLEWHPLPVGLPISEWSVLAPSVLACLVGARYRAIALSAISRLTEGLPLSKAWNRVLLVSTKYFEVDSDSLLSTYLKIVPAAKYLLRDNAEV